MLASKVGLRTLQKERERERERGRWRERGRERELRKDARELGLMHK